MIIHTDSVRYIWEVLENNEYSFLFDKLIVLDAGCNIGSFSLWIYPHTNRIYAVDCEQGYVDHFNRTIKDNNLQSITTYVERLQDLGVFMSGQGIDFVDLLKLDVEGDEIAILQNNFPKDRVRMIVGEYHNQPVEKLLTDLGYRYFEFPNKHFVARI